MKRKLKSETESEVRYKAIWEKEKEKKHYE